MLHYTLFTAQHNNNNNNKDKKNTPAAPERLASEAADTYFQFRPCFTELAGHVSPGNVEQDDLKVPHSAAKFALPEHFKPLLVVDSGIAPPNPLPFWLPCVFVLRFGSDSSHHSCVKRPTVLSKRPPACGRGMRAKLQIAAPVFSPPLGFINAATPHSNCAVRPKNASPKSTTACLLRDAWPRTCSRPLLLRIYVANPPRFLIFFFQAIKLNRTFFISISRQRCASH